MKYFLDLGHHYGQGLAEFTPKLEIEPEGWRVHCWECNPRTRARWAVGYTDQPGVTFHDEAIWTDDSGVTMHQEDNNKTGDGWGSTVMDESSHPLLTGHVEVPSVSLVKWIRENTTAGDEVHIKMDIEGAEYPVLRDMLDYEKNYDPSLGGAPIFPRIKSMSVEFHDRFIPGETIKTSRELAAALTQLTEFTWHW